MTDGRIIPVNIETELKSAYIDYSMSVIVARALPDVRDGLKPVHRRVLYGMYELGLPYGRPHKKSARIVGEVLGKYHPHGDSSVYDTMVRMAQPWSLRYPLVDGQGNFGSVDGDSPAAMRYTEARLAKISEAILQDIEKDTVDFRPNFDDSLKEPTVLPTKIPLLLINGASGIAVGMATNILPHNLREVNQAIKATIDNPEITVDELMEHIKGPDLPTGGIIHGVSGIHDYMETGRGKVVVRGRATIETSKTGKESIIITEIPYQVNKAMLIKKIADLVNAEKLTGISDVRDESDRKGMRIVIELKRDTISNVVLSSLYKYTPLQTSYGVNNIALVDGRPVLLSTKQMIEEFVKFRLEVIVRRTQYELRKAEERAHILEGLLIALDHLDEVIALIRASKTVDDARVGLMKTFDLSEIQAKAILDMRLQKLTGLERDKLKAEYEELLEKIAHYKSILDSEAKQKQIVKDELDEVSEKYGDERRTDITFSGGDISIEDMIPDEKVVITISHLGYIKRTKEEEYKRQGRGGTGSRGSKTRSEDFIEHIFTATNHNYLMLFTQRGRCFWLKVYEIPEATKVSLGRNIRNIISIPKDDQVKAYIVVKDLSDQEFLNHHYILFATKKGLVKKTVLEAYSRPRVNGIFAININEHDELIEVRLTDGNNQILLAKRKGKAIRFHESKVRSMGRGATGVRGTESEGPEDTVVGMICMQEGDDKTVLVVSEKGLGKRSELEDYRMTNRGGKGVKTIQVTEKTGNLIAVKAVSDEDDLIITTRKGIVIRTAVAAIRVMGRATQGVKIIKLKNDDAIADVAVIQSSPVSEEEE